VCQLKTKKNVLHVHLIAIEIGIVRRRPNKFVRRLKNLHLFLLHTLKDLGGRLTEVKLGHIEGVTAGDTH
jgi:hypothetical protein